MVVEPFIFGDAELGLYLHVAKITRPIAPTRRFNTANTLRGQYIASNGFEAYELQVEVNLRGVEVMELAELRRQLAKMLYSESEQKLILPDEPDKYYMAIWKGGAELDRLFRFPSATLTFILSDPIARGRERTVTLSTSNQTVKRGGTFKSFPTITGKPASGSYWTVYNTTTGEFVRVEASFTGSQTVIFDFEKQRCTVNGADHQVLVTSDFFALDETQSIKLSSGSATMTWQERWL